MPAYTSTVPPYKDDNIFICDIVDLLPEDDDVKEDRAIRETTYNLLKDEMDITVKSVTDSEGDAVILAADADVTPTSGASPLEITFDASASTGAGLTFSWELDIDGGGYNEISTEKVGTYTTLAAGTHTFRLTITDVTDTTDTDSVIVTAS